MKKKQRGDGRVEMDAFDELKLIISESPVLCLYELSLPLILAFDASYYGLGVVISHIYPDGTEKPIAFASRILNKHEVNCFQVEKEGASIIFGLKKFNQYLLGRQFIISTDNSAIRKIFDPSTAIRKIFYLQ